jgi:lipoprotein Spr
MLTPGKYMKSLPAMLLAVWLMGCGPSRKTVVHPPSSSSIPANENLGLPVPAHANPRLVEAIAGWKGTPYLYGGNSKSGVDCSGLIGQIYPSVYGIRPPRTTAELYAGSVRVDRSKLQEGDLVFFRIETVKPGHAGIYLWDSYFLHASTTRGVMVSNLQEAYWCKYFAGGGRLASQESIPSR